jgi:hypothetical protein
LLFSRWIGQPTTFTEISFGKFFYNLQLLESPFRKICVCRRYYKRRFTIVPTPSKWWVWICLPFGFKTIKIKKLWSRFSFINIFNSWCKIILDPNLSILHCIKCSVQSGC